MSNRLISTLHERMWRKLSCNPLRPAVLRELFKRVTKAQKQPSESKRSAMQ